MNDKPKNIDDNTELKETPKVDEFGGVYFSSFVKIHDPNTEEVLVHIRGDN